MSEYFDPWEHPTDRSGAELVGRIDMISAVQSAKHPEGAASLDPAAGLGALWNELVELKIPYLDPPWHASEWQIIRDPDWVRHQGGTCLDLVVFASGLAIGHQLRPLVLLITGKEVDHAGLGFDLRTGLKGWEEDAEIDDFLEQFNVVPHPDHLEVDPAVLLSAWNGRSIALFDPTLATRNADHPPDHGASSLAGAIRSAQHIDVIDVQAVSIYHYDTVAGISRPNTSQRPAISFQAPAMPTWTPFPQRVAEIERSIEQLSEHNRLVLTGRTGQGKSMLARRIVHESGTPSTWFLPASSYETLRASLARAIATEIGIVDVTDEMTATLAAEAQYRLASSKEPWLVVLDNVTATPKELSELLPHSYDPRQQVVVTTSGDALVELNAWRDWAQRTASVIELLPLENVEDSAVETLLAELEVDLSPLALRLAQPLTTTPWNAHRPSPAGTWEIDQFDLLVSEAMTRLDPQDRSHLHRAAWLPSEGIPASAFGESANALREAGFIVESGLGNGLFDMHRLIGSGVRTNAGEDSRAMALECLGETTLREALQQRADLEAIGRLGGAIGDLWSRVVGAPDIKLAQAMVDLGEILESMGRVVARKELDWTRAETFHRAIVTSPDATDTLAGLAPLALAIALHGAARGVNQGPRGAVLDEVRVAVTWAERAASLRRTLGDADGPLLASGSDALAALLRIKLHRLSDLAAPDRLRLIADEIAHLERSRDERTAFIDSRGPQPTFTLEREKARAIFNLGGASNDLAVAATKAIRSGDVDATSAPDVWTLLDSAEQAYRESLEIRQRFSFEDGRADETIAACHWGLSLIRYQRTWLGTLDVGRRAELLRLAGESVERSLRIRERIDSDDRANVMKSFALSYKINRARLRLVGESKLKDLDDQEGVEQPELEMPR